MSKDDKYSKIAHSNDAWLDPAFPGTLDTRGVGIGVTPLPSADESFVDEKFGATLAREGQGIRNSLVRMINDSPDDKEIRAELKDVTQESENVTVAGHAARVSWESGEFVVTVDVTWDDNTEETLEWRGDDRSAVLLDAAAYLKNQMAPKAVQPSPAALLRVRRLAGSQQIGQALEEFLLASFPGVSKASAENLWNDPSMAHVFDEAVFTVWAAASPNFNNDPQFRPWLQVYKGQRPLTVVLCQTAFEQYTRELSLGRVVDALPKDPTASDLDNLSDEEIDRLRRASLNAYHKQVRGGR